MFDVCYKRFLSSHLRQKWTNCGGEPHPAHDIILCDTKFRNWFWNHFEHLILFVDFAVEVLVSTSCWIVLCNTYLRTAGRISVLNRGRDSSIRLHDEKGSETQPVLMQSVSWDKAGAWFRLLYRHIVPRLRMRAVFPIISNRFNFELFQPRDVFVLLF
jgi:hypothetical protein